MNIGGTEKAFLNLVDTMSPEEYDLTLILLEKEGGFLSFVPEWVHIKTINNHEKVKREILEPPLQIIKSYIKMGKFIDSFGILLTHIWSKISGNRTLYYRWVLRESNLLEHYDEAVAYCGPFDLLTVYVLFCVKSKRKIQWIHFDVSKFSFNQKLAKRLYPRFDQIKVVSDEARKELVKIIPSIKNITRTSFNIVSENKCVELSLSGSGFQDSFQGIRIVTVGRLSQEKGQDIIPNVAAIISQKYDDFCWYLIGDGNWKSKIEKEIEHYGVKEKVVFLGTQVNPYPFLRDTDLYVQTSLHEGYCITLAEARVFNLPIVSTDCAGAHDQLDERPHSLIVERQAEQIAEAIIKLLIEMGKVKV